MTKLDIFRYCAYALSVLLWIALGNSMLSGRVARGYGSLSPQFPAHRRHARWLLAVIVAGVPAIEILGSLFVPDFHRHSKLFWFAHFPCTIVFLATFIPIMLGLNGLNNKKLHRRLGYACFASGCLMGVFGDLIAYLR